MIDCRQYIELAHIRKLNQKVVGLQILSSHSLSTLLRPTHGGEQLFSHCGNRLLEDHFEAIVELLRADDAVLARVHDEAAKAGVRRVRRVQFRQKVAVIDSDNAGDIILTLKSLDLAEHGLLVLGNSIVNDTREKANVALSAPERDLGLNQLNQALDEKILQEIRVL